MTVSDELFSAFQKEMRLYLKEKGFKKNKAFYVRPMKDAKCHFHFGKIRGHSEASIVRLNAGAFLRFGALDFIFRPEVSESNVDLVVTDIGHLFGAYKSGVFELDNVKDLQVFVTDFQRQVNEVLEDFEEMASLEWFATNFMSGSEDRPSLKVLMKRAVAAKTLGLLDVHQMLSEKIEKLSGACSSNDKFYIEKMKKHSFL